MAKALRAIVKEVAEPVPGDEKRAKDKHIIALTKDVEGNDEHPYKAITVKKDKSKATSLTPEEEEEMYEDSAHQDKGSSIMTPGQVDTMAKLTKERITGHHLKWAGNVRKQYFDLVKTFNAQVAQGAIAGSGKYITNEESIINDLKSTAKEEYGTESQVMTLDCDEDVEVSSDIAKALLNCYEQLSEDNADKFRSSITRSPEHFQSMVDLANLIMDEEDLDELSKKTLRDYTKSANSSSIKLAHSLGQGRDKTGKTSTKIMNRHQGVNRAVNRLAK